MIASVFSFPTIKIKFAAVPGIEAGNCRQAAFNNILYELLVS